MRIPRDFREFLQSLAAAGVKHVIVGADGDLELRFISRENLIRNKRAAGRPQDLADLERL